MQIVVHPGLELYHLGDEMVTIAESRGFKGYKVFHPEDLEYENGSRFVISVEVDSNDSKKDLILKPAYEEAFTFGGPSPDVAVLETSYRAPLLVNEEMHAHFRLVDELQPLVKEMGAELQRRVLI